VDAGANFPVGYRLLVNAETNTSTVKNARIALTFLRTLSAAEGPKKLD
jgi:hypothetical protein